MYEIIFHFILFLIYSFIGWLMEVSKIMIKEKKFVNRGFLVGPYCPIYGFSSIVMILYLDNYKDNIITVFLLAFVICSVIEYLISYIMEKMFSARWWDYSDDKFNINGRVCLENALIFGLLGVFLVYIANPFITNLISKINHNYLIGIGAFWLIIFISDVITSNIITFNLKNKIKTFNADVTEELSNLIKERFENTIFNRRIFKAYPKYRINMIKKYTKEKDKIIENIQNIIKK